jgi:hydrogenase maturation protein HypF
MSRQLSGSIGQKFRWRFLVAGAVQGVGFRPFVYRLARELGLTGFVANNSQGVIIEVEGSESLLHDFSSRLSRELPSRAIIEDLVISLSEARGSSGFVIAVSDQEGGKSAYVLPDIATCPDCLGEIFAPSDRRYLYPFTNCTNCGPRFSIIESLPYDRANTTMKAFTMCSECEREYRDPDNRRFHAQPNACPQCGPHIELWTSTGAVIASRQEAIVAAAEQVAAGKIVALKGIGGFQLLVDAGNDTAVGSLRARKRRSNKPFALLYPNLESLQRDCQTDDLESALILSPESPIVIVRRRVPAGGISELIAPRNPWLGVMLPYTPLHHILMRQLNRPVVATSGNLSEEPLCIDEHEALRRLQGIADFYLVHNRPIRRHVDDSVVRVMAGRAQIMRRARGFAPLPITMSKEQPDAIAVGGHLKNTVAISRGKNIFVSQHIGDLESAESLQAFKASLQDLSSLYDLAPTSVAHDLHPDYASTIHAETLSIPRVAVQHHYAHILACMADNQIEGPLLGVAWDGSGYGTDRTVWGGEFLAVDNGSYRRVAYLMPFQLPGGDAAVKEPRRSAAGVTFELCADSYSIWRRMLSGESFSDSEADIVWKMLMQKLNSPVTSSIGRLFDAVAALTGLSQKCTFEGEAAMLLEFATDNQAISSSYPFELRRQSEGYKIDWRLTILAILHDVHEACATATIAAKFHNTLVELIVEVARRVRLRNVALSGGCFMNKYLTERAIIRLRANGFVPYWHNQIPTNDGGIAVGQLKAAFRSAGK